MCALVTRLLLFMYMNQSFAVRWNSHTSEKFSVSNGVKQGGIITPVLYCIYTDNLLEMLNNSGSGCYIGYDFCGAVAYADDLLLLSPAVTGMKRMLSICETCK